MRSVSRTSRRVSEEVRVCEGELEGFFSFIASRSNCATQMCVRVRVCIGEERWERMRLNIANSETMFRSGE